MLLCVSMLSITSVIKTFHMGGKPPTALIGRKYKSYEFISLLSSSSDFISISHFDVPHLITFLKNNLLKNYKLI